MPLRELTSGFIKSIQRHTVTVLLSLVVLSSLYGFFGLATMAALNVRSLMSRWGSQLELTVYLEDATNADQLRLIQTNIRNIPHVNTVETISREQAKQQFAQHLASYAPDLVNDPEFENVFPASLLVKLDSALPSTEIAELSKQIRILKGVTEVNYGQEWISNFKNFSQAIQKLGVVFLAIFGIAGLFVIGNLQRMTISDRSEEIEILELIGATSARIRAPFLFEGAAIGLLASICGLLFCALIYFVQAKILIQDLPFLDILGQVRFFSWTEGAGFCAAGSALGITGSWFATRHISDSWYAAKQRSET